MSPSLDDAAEHFQPKRKQITLLQENKIAVLRLRSKGATCAEIEAFLKQNGINVSEASIVRFCRRHMQELKRGQSPPQDSIPATRPQSPTAPISQSKVRDLRGPV